MPTVMLLWQRHLQRWETGWGRSPQLAKHASFPEACLKMAETEGISPVFRLST